MIKQVTLQYNGKQGTEPPIPIPIPIPDLPESGIKLSTISGLPQCLTLRLIAQPIKLVNLRKPAMSDDAADYSGTSDSGQ